jgi:iduronate 2-sulfatase
MTSDPRASRLPWLAPGAALLAAAISSVFVLATCRAPRAKRPNVLLIVADDLSYRIGLYGFAARTPSLERLAARGRRFDRAYCQYPLCSPSRTSFLTGWRPEHTKVWGNLRPPRAFLEGAVPLQEHFQTNGYFTARVGKVYHSRFEEEFRWDLVVDTYDAVPEEAPVVWGPSPRRDEEEPDGRAARRAAEILAGKRDRPFFLAVGFLKPHDPWVVPEAYFRMYPPESVTLPREDPGAASLFEPRRGVSLNLPREKWKEALAAYYASVTFVDAQLGVILDAMDREGRWDDTVVVLLSDNGLHVGEHGIFGKMTLFEESARVPLVIAAPGLKRPGTPTGRIAELLDVYPTLVELARLPKVNGLEGTSLVPLLEDPERSVKASAHTMRKVGATRKGQLGRSVRSERWRYTEWPDETVELYDHDRDPDELDNRAGDPAAARALAEMRAMLPAER